MRVLSKILRVFALLPVVFRNIALVAFLSVTAMLFLESVIRTVFNVSITRITEVGQIGMLLLVTLGIAWVYQVGGHLKVGIAADRIPDKQSRILNLFLSILSLAFVIFATHIWWHMTAGAIESGREFFQLGIVQWPFMLAAVAGWGVLGIAVIERIVNQLKQIFGKSLHDR